MIKKKVLILALISILYQFSCIDEVEFENNKIFDRINISGQLSDDMDMKIVVIKKIPSENDASLANGVPIENADVHISDNFGNLYAFTSAGKGVYTSEMKGIIGRRYKLEVKMGDHIYESKNQTMMNNAPIDSIRPEIASEEVIDFTGQIISNKVVNLVLNTNLESEVQPIYTVYRITGEYEFHEVGIMGSFQLPKICYVNQTLDFGKINVLSGRSFPNNRVREKEVYRTDHDYRFLHNYSFLVNQYAIDSTTYIYWKQVAQISKEKQNLFDPPPGRVTGNIYCTSHEGQDPYGYFTVASKTEKRIFTNSIKLGVPGINVCSRNTIRICFDCLSISSSTLTRPPYWL